MTRKCALCKKTNYKNNYSFFSAPKDPETRKKWQIALGIENCTVMDDTYVCSNHFHKNDIITHWVSGVPPQEIKIKYKKCRLRPGAVPGRKFHHTYGQSDKDHSSKCDINLKENRSTESIWEVAPTDFCVKDESVNNSLETTDDVYISSPVLAPLIKDKPDAQSKLVYDDVDKSEMLFEDFLEVCTEVSVPRGWSCLVTSKGYSTTVVYLYMSIMEDGLPFVEKQVFLKSDMILRCAVVNKEIDPVVYNLMKKDRHIKVRSFSDIEELVDEFNRQIVCQGVCDLGHYGDDSTMKVAYKDGIKWRHNSCPLIIDSGLFRCTKCSVLSRTLVHKSRKFIPSNYPTEITRSTESIHVTASNPKTYRRMRLSTKTKHKDLEND